MSFVNMTNAPKCLLLIASILFTFSNLSSNTVVTTDSGVTIEYGSTNSVVTIESGNIFSNSYTSEMNTALKNSAILTELSSSNGIRTTADFDWDTVNVIDNPD